MEFLGLIGFDMDDDKLGLLEFDRIDDDILGLVEFDRMDDDISRIDRI